ncbi:MAG TPA: calcium/sodium antiporter [Gemmatimonadales bacterium]|nr:calcium/sodium antiporter [Gemmatimonadales bacterium]
MDLFPALLTVLLGLALLAVGGELLVRGATTIARLAGLTPAVIGLTIVAAGTSLPELVVSVVAALHGTPDIAVGNVVGSNIFNIAIVLGAAALVLPLRVHATAVRLEWPIMFLASWTGFLLMRDFQLDRMEGGFFVASLIVFMAYSVYIARYEVSEEEATDYASETEGRSIHPRSRQLAASILAVVAGSALLVLGGKFLVGGSIVLARFAGMSERVIGLTVVAVGTSAPELAASLVAAYRGRADLALANIIGSNIFNILGILGITALVHPIPVAAGIVQGDAWWMLGFAVVLLPMMWTGKRISRTEGALLLVGYCAYLAALLRP